MKKAILFHLIILVFACSSTKKNLAVSKTDAFDISMNNDSIDMKSLFELSPISIFDLTTEGISSSEKEELIKQGESVSWKIIEENKTKLSIQCKYPSSEITFYFLKNRDNLDGVLAAEVINEKVTNIQLWKYFHEDKSLQERDMFKKYQANDFVSKEDKLPDTYKPVLHYQFVDDQTIEVSLDTWMNENFENREIINRILLKWNGEKFEENIERIKK